MLRSICCDRETLQLKTACWKIKLSWIIICIHEKWHLILILCSHISFILWLHWVFLLFFLSLVAHSTTPCHLCYCSLYSHCLCPHSWTPVLMRWKPFYKLSFHVSSPQRKMWTVILYGFGVIPLWAQTWDKSCSGSAAWRRTAGTFTLLSLVSSVVRGTTSPQ